MDSPFRCLGRCPLMSDLLGVVLVLTAKDAVKWRFGGLCFDIENGMA